MPTPLPTHIPYDATTNVVPRAAYNYCLDLESRHHQVRQHGRLNVLICARMLGYLLLEAPTEQGRQIVASEIVHCGSQGDAYLQQLAELYKARFLRSFYKIKGEFYADPDPYPSALSPEVEGGSKCAQQGSPLSYWTSKRQALIRDQHRCLISQSIDSRSMEHGFISPQSAGRHDCTFAVSILNRPVTGGHENECKTDLTMFVDALLVQYGQIDATNELSGDKHYRLQNILTLSSLMYWLFDSLEIWLERNDDDPPNTYRPASTRSNWLSHVPATITLSAHDPLFPLPDPRHLALHAACARVAHMSGVGEHIITAIFEITDNGASGHDVLGVFY